MVLLQVLEEAVGEVPGSFVNPGVLVHQGFSNCYAPVDIFTDQPNVGDLVAEVRQLRFFCFGDAPIICCEPALGSLESTLKMARVHCS